MTTPSCPYCGNALAKMPARKTKCPACGNAIHVKSTPDDRTKRVMTEAQAQVAEARWAQMYPSNAIWRLDEATALEILKSNALFELERLAKSAKAVPGIKVQICAGVGARHYEICRAMEAQPVATVEDELRNPRLPNPTCPSALGTIKKGYCTCRYAAWKEDWVIDRPPRR